MENLPISLPAAAPEIADTVLLQEITNGSQHAFDIVYQRYEDKIIRWAMHYLPSQDLARDVCQEVMIRLLKSPPAALKDDSLSPWLCRVTRNLAVDRIRSNWREVLLPDHAETAAGNGSYDPLPDITAKDDADLLGMLLEELDEELRSVVKMRIYREMPFREIADKLNIPIGTALWRMNHATQLLRNQWRRMQTE